VKKVVAKRVSKSPVKMRRSPSQARAVFTVDAIMEAAYLLVAEGKSKSFTTNRIAQRAGLSIGSLYQYFPDKESVVLALIEEERRKISGELRSVFDSDYDGDFEGSVRRACSIMVAQSSRNRQLSQNLEIEGLRSGLAKSLAPQLDRFAEVLVDRWRQSDPERKGSSLSPAERFVVTRSIVGILRSAALEGSSMPEEPAFVDALSRLICSFFRDTAKKNYQRAELSSS
jgi:AcrR family transcriptional regulator